MGRGPGALLVVFAILITVPASALGGASFTIGGRAAAPQETNFAGARHPSPTYQVVIQMNHDTRADGILDLALVDDVYRGLRQQHRREPYFALDALPVVFIADDKMRRFISGPRRLLFGQLETDIRAQQEVYPTPNAIFVTDAVLADGKKLRAALQLALSHLFNADFYRAVVGLDRAVPRPAD